MQGIHIDEIRTLLNNNGYTLDIHPTKNPLYTRGFIADQNTVQFGRITIYNGYFQHIKWYKYGEYHHIEAFIDDYIEKHTDKVVDVTILLTKFAQIQPIDGEMLNDMFYMPLSRKDKIMDKLKGTKLCKMLNF